MNHTETKAENLPEILKVHLENNGIKQIWLARKVGISQPALSNIISGKSTPSLKTFLKILEVLDIKFFN